MLKKAMSRMFTHAHLYNSHNIARLAREYVGKIHSMCDFGAGDGSVTRLVAEAVNPVSVSVVEVELESAKRLRSMGYQVHQADLNAPLNLDREYDVVIANQVIEHLYDTDIFVKSMFQATKPGGVALISTENLASWHNVIALLFGWQPFSLTNITGLAGGVGNPLAFFGGRNGACFEMQHHRLFTARALRELMEAHGFTSVRVEGSGYYPLPAQVGRIDPSHAHFITAIGRRPAL